MKERMKRCFEKNSVLLFFVSFRQKNLTNFVCLFFFCFLFFCNKRVKNIKFSRKTTFSSLVCFLVEKTKQKIKILNWASQGIQTSSQKKKKQRENWGRKKKKEKEKRKR